MTLNEYVANYFVQRQFKKSPENATIRKEAQKLLNDPEKIDAFLIFLDDEWTKYEEQISLENTASRARMVGLFGLILFPILMILSFKGMLFGGNLIFIPYGLIAASIGLFLIANQKMKLAIEMKRRREILINKWS